VVGSRSDARKARRPKAVGTCDSARFHSSPAGPLAGGDFAVMVPSPTPLSSAEPAPLRLTALVSYLILYHPTSLFPVRPGKTGAARFPQSSGAGPMVWQTPVS